ncbi:MAG: hypothetical protein ACLU7D_11340 [Collinsella sp.]
MDTAGWPYAAESACRAWRLRDVVSGEGDGSDAGHAASAFAADTSLSAPDLGRRGRCRLCPRRVTAASTLRSWPRPAVGPQRRASCAQFLNLVHDHLLWGASRADIIVLSASLVLIYTDGRDEPAGNVDEAAELIAKMVAKDQVKVVFLGFGDFDRATAEQLTKSCGGYFEANFDASDGVPFDRFFHLL